MSMEIAQLYKSTCNNQLQQSTYLCHKEKHVSNMAGEHFGRAQYKGHTMMHTYTP